MRILPTSLLAGMILLAVPGATWAGWEEGHAAFARRDYSSALREWMPLAESGHVEAQLNIAFMYNQGLGVPVDHGVARRWYHRAAEQGLAEAQAQLGVVYSQGLGVAPNYDEAVKWSTINSVRSPARQPLPPGSPHRSSCPKKTKYSDFKNAQQHRAGRLDT